MLKSYINSLLKALQKRIVKEKNEKMMALMIAFTKKEEMCGNIQINTAQPYLYQLKRNAFER